MKTYIYVLKDPITFEVRYVGKTTSIRKRFISHKCLKSNKGNYLSSWIASLRNKKLIPIMESIDLVENGEWKEKESYYIEFYKKQGCNLVNLTLGGEGCDGYKHTKETILKMSKIQKLQWEMGQRSFIPTFKGKKHTEEEKIKISQRFMGEKNHNFGKKISQTVKEKISKKLGKEMKINGIIYPSLRCAAKSLSLDWSTFRYRYKMGLRLT